MRIGNMIEGFITMYIRVKNMIEALYLKVYKWGKIKRRDTAKFSSKYFTASVCVVLK